MRVISLFQAIITKVSGQASILRRQGPVQRCMKGISFSSRFERLYLDTVQDLGGKPSTSGKDVGNAFNHASGSYPLKAGGPKAACFCQFSQGVLSSVSQF